MPIVYKHTSGVWTISRGSPAEDIKFESLLKEKGIPYKVVKKIPSLRSLEKWSEDGICPTPDGCRVEPDGHCQHGFPSWLLIMGFI